MNTQRERALALAKEAIACYLHHDNNYDDAVAEAADLIEAAINHEATERVAAWMLAHSYATGHGETVEDLLNELVRVNHDKTT